MQSWTVNLVVLSSELNTYNSPPLCLCRIDARFFFFKQKTAYEMRISDWSSDVCSSDLSARIRNQIALNRKNAAILASSAAVRAGKQGVGEGTADQIGRASCRERVCQYV